MRWWDAAYGAGERAAGEAAASRRRTDVFGIARPEMPEDAAKHLAHLQWLGLKPGSDLRVAASKEVEAVVCSGQGPNDVQVRGRGAGGERSSNRRQLAAGGGRGAAAERPRRARRLAGASMHS